MRLKGIFFGALSAKQLSGEIEFSERAASIFRDDNYVCKGVGITSIQNKTDIYLENGFLFTLEQPLTDEQENDLVSGIGRRLAWLEKFSPLKAIVLGLVLVSSLVILRYSLTVVSPILVQIFPIDLEKKIGQNTYDTLKKTVFKKSGLSSERIKRLKKKALKIASANGFDAPQVLFHKSDLIGPNAIAFAGGPVVITDDLVLLLKRDNLILSVISHEFAHVQQRHSLQQIIEIIGLAALASVFFGSNDTLIEEASVIGINLWASKKSRALEKEADLLALRYMAKANMNKSAFSMAIKELTKHLCGVTASKAVNSCLKNSKSGWFSTHPSGAERLRYLNHSHE